MADCKVGMVFPDMVEVRDVVKQYRLGGETIEALRGASLAVQRGEMVSILGPSGSGKSTLLGLLGGLDTPTSGSVLLDGLDIARLDERRLTRVRNEKIGFVFQFFNLIPTLTALENVALPLQFAARRRYAPTRRATELLAHLGLGDRLNHLPTQLSGGQQQRVAIARALANDPPILLADEPTGNLNREAGALVIDTIRRVRAEFGTTVILVTHDPEVSGQAERVLWLVDGLIVSKGGEGQ